MQSKTDMWLADGTDTPSGSEVCVRGGGGFTELEEN